MSRLFFGPTVELRGLGGGVIARDLQIDLQFGAPRLQFGLPRPLSLLQLVRTSPLPGPIALFTPSICSPN